MGPQIVSLLIGVVLIVISAVQALETSAGVGLQDRAMFQETVDYTLPTRPVGIHRQNLANTFAGLLDATPTSATPIFTVRSSRRVPSQKRISVVLISPMP